MPHFELLNSPSVWQSLTHFWRFDDMNVVWVLAGSMLLGISASVIGGFALLRKRALIGDALAHAALPGVMMAFLLLQTRDPWVMLLGAMISSFVGFYLIDWLPKHTKIKADAALAITLSFFFALGLMLLSYIQGLEVENKSGLDKILFGQAAAMTRDDINLLLAVTIFVLINVVMFFHKLRLIAFNRQYARTLGVNVTGYELLLALLIVLAVVVGLQLVGVVLMAAVLLTPAAAARFWSNQLARILMIAAALGAISALVSTHISYLAPAMPTGPWMVVNLALLFFISLLFAPYKGLLNRALQRRRLGRKIAKENVLRTLYKLLERNDFKDSLFHYAEIQAQRSLELNTLKHTLNLLAKKGLVHVTSNGIALTPAGLEQAALLTHRHRLWENYLNQEVALNGAQAHKQAERIEHILTDAQANQIEYDMGISAEKTLSAPMITPKGVNV
ncbi:iron chelate uptake ABC transporter family permease subunit [Thiomicrorhabdus aquaedulcis]|uniref:metal ABC transporter permease n=1 Tax=Thiomicrorhabdus aquaedulcis TaxID=2211106 RepID=UPI000FDAFFC3|nr:iron chelate uptake ABC transporter family permease subunit [Thiomicrorhabdus aquaedulcis]